MPPNEREKLMAVIMDRLAEKFGNHAILKGGMELRLLDCQRLTNDLDYVFIPFSSKNEIKDSILCVLREIPGMEVSLSVHSTCIRYLVSNDATQVQVEVNVANECSSDVLTTGTFAALYGLQPKLIRGMHLECALSHKLAAWNERRLIRDLFDAAFMKSTLGIAPDRDTLRQRLTKVIARDRKMKLKHSMSLEIFINELEIAAVALDQNAVEKELRDYFDPTQLPGLALKIKAGIRDIIDLLRKRENHQS
jgi:predicted nucleotidyltransferase component of viral defense system